MALLHGRVVSFVAHDGTVLQPALVAEQRDGHWVSLSTCCTVHTSPSHALSACLCSSLPIPLVAATCVSVLEGRPSTFAAVVAHGRASCSRRSLAETAFASRVLVIGMRAGHAFSLLAAPN